MGKFACQGILIGILYCCCVILCTIVFKVSKGNEIDFERIRANIIAEIIVLIVTIIMLFTKFLYKSNSTC